MSAYSPRKIDFIELIEVGDWKLKVYFINQQEDELTPHYEEVKRQLPQWLEMHNRFDSQHEHLGFLIIHGGSEGVFHLINWWVGNNMLNSHIFFSPIDQAGLFSKISGDGLMACIWELEVINFERIAWTEHTLKPSTPAYTRYLTEQYHGTF